MAIPESQLNTWSSQGSITQSASTYSTVKRALEDVNTKYAKRDFDVFLQGSYGNDTNIYAESDVDIVIRYNGAFFHDLTELSPDQKASFTNTMPDGTYLYNTFKSDVCDALDAAFGSSVKPDKKAIKIEANSSRRNSDVIVAFEFRRYFKFNGVHDQRFDKGIAFFASDGTRTANYPKQHSENSTAKHQATGNNYKPLVRIFKNMRSKLHENGLIGEKDAPSYFIEGLLYNVPNEYYSGSYQNIVLNILRWLIQTKDRTKFVCVNEQYFLLRDNAPNCWPTSSGEKFISAAIQLWNNW